VRLAKGLPNYDDGYNISHPQVFDVVAKDVADGVDLFVSIKKGAPAPSGTLTPALNVMLDVDGPEIGEEPIPKAFRLDLTWPHGDAPPGPVANANHGR
jgi:hypothetical protein